MNRMEKETLTPEEMEDVQRLLSLNGSQHVLPQRTDSPIPILKPALQPRRPYVERDMAAAQQAPQPQGLSWMAYAGAAAGAVLLGVLVWKLWPKQAASASAAQTEAMTDELRRQIYEEILDKSRRTAAATLAKK